MEPATVAGPAPIERPTNIHNPDMPGPRFCCYLTVDEVEQIAMRAKLSLTVPLVQQLQHAVAKFAKCQPGKLFPRRSIVERELTRVEKSLTAAANDLKDFDCRAFFGSSRTYVHWRHVDRRALQSDLAAIAPYIKIKKRSRAVLKAAAVLNELNSAGNGDTCDVDVRLRLDLIRLLQQQEQQVQCRTWINTVEALQRLADMADAARYSLDDDQVLSGAFLSGEWARAQLIRELNAIYIEAGGRRPGWLHDRDSDEHQGPLLEMVGTVLDLSGQPLKNTSLAQALRRALPQ